MYLGLLVLVIAASNDFKKAHNGEKIDRKVQVLPWTFCSVNIVD